nr:HAMP domain-containing protein [bacterium]
MNIHRAFKSRLGRKLILYFLITGFAPLLIFIYFITGEYKSGILENISKDLKKNTIIISSKIFEDILERKNELKFIASTFQLKSLSGASETALIKKTIDESLVEFFKFSNLTVFDFKTKKILCSTKKDTQQLNIKENLFKENSLLFINHKNGDIKSSGQNTSGTEFPDIYLSFPITKKNEVSIILIGELNKNYLWEVTQSLYHIGNSNMAIFDENNKVLIHTFENHSFIDALNSARFFKEEKNSEVFIEHNEALGEIFFCYYKIYMKGQFGCGNWTVISTKKSEEALDSINNLIHTVYISASVSILLLLLISLILTRQISDPVSLLVEGSKEISEGNMNFRITLKKTNDEIGELLGAFDIMTNNLRETTVSKNYLSNILNSINDFIIVINENYQIESVNDGILALGYIPSSLERKNIEILFEKSDFVVVKNKLYNFLAHKKIEEINSNLIGADGQKIPVEIQFTFFAPKKESIEKIIIICRDLREKIKLADEKNFLLKNLQESYKNLNNTQNQLIQSEKMAAIGTLTAGITHEINTPVT